VSVNREPDWSIVVVGPAPPPLDAGAVVVGVPEARRSNPVGTSLEPTALFPNSRDSAALRSSHSLSMSPVN
jgi:hypothetical protein